MRAFEPQQLPIGDIQWDSLIPLIGKATRSLAYYDGILYGLANPDVLCPFPSRDPGSRFILKDRRHAGYLGRGAEVRGRGVSG